MPKVTIPLPTPIDGPKGPIREVVLRQPTYDEYLQHGRPYTVSRTAEGLPLFVENREVIRTYARLLMVEPDPLALGPGGAHLGMLVEDAILSFFQDPPATGGA